MTRTLTLISTLILISQSAFCQISNVLEGSKWKEVRCNYWSSIATGIYFVDNWRIEGDTIINDISYKKIYNHQQDFMFGIVNNSDEDLLVSSSDYYYGAIREENQQVFIHSESFFDPDAPLTEKMMFDYAASVGDTVSIWCGYNYLDYIVDEIIPTEMYDGSIRNKFILSGNSGTGFFGMSFIEGIGCNYGLVGAYLGTTNDQMQHLLCYSINDSIILENSAEYTSNCLADPIQESCNAEILSNNNPDNSENSLLIYPNPASDEFIVKGQKPNDKLQGFRLFSPEGRVLLNENSSYSELLRIDVSTLPSGIYFLEIILNDSERFIEKVLVNH